MYPSDDRPLRVRLLINECREIRRRLEKQVERSRALRARAARPRSGAGGPLRQDGAKLEWWGGGGERSAEPAAGLRARVKPAARPTRS